MGFRRLQHALSVFTVLYTQYTKYYKKVAFVVLGWGLMGGGDAACKVCTGTPESNTPDPKTEILNPKILILNANTPNL